MAACIPTWLTDFRPDLAKIDVPILVIHGDDDNVLPYGTTAARLPGLIKDLRTVVISGGPHAIAWTHADQVNAALLQFLRGARDGDKNPARDGTAAASR